MPDQIMFIVWSPIATL